MKAVGLFETKNRLSEICRCVAATGEPCVITRRGEPMVQIVPIPTGRRESVWSTVEEGCHRHGPLEDGLELPERGTARNRPSPL